MPQRRVVVTGIGLITPLGNDKETSWRSLTEGKSGVGRVTHFDISEFTSKIGAEVKGFDPTLFLSLKDVKRMDMFVQFAVSASHMALKNAGIDTRKEDANRIGCIIGSGIGGLETIERECFGYSERGPLLGPKKISPFLIPRLIVNMAPGQVAISLGLKGPNSCVATACASGSHAIGDAFKIIARGDADVVLAGGTESATTPLGFGGFCAMKALSLRNDDPEHASRPFDKERDGFVMGEGAGVIVLEDMDRAINRGAHIYAEITGYGMTCDAYHMTAPSPDGEGAARAMNMALDDAKIPAEDVTYINAHGTSTHLNDKMETSAIKKVFGDSAKKVAVSSTKSMMGHLLGAAGGVEAAICAMAIEKGIIPPTTNYKVPDPDCDLDYVPNTARDMDVDVAMSNSFGFGGHNATLVFKKFKG
ncbi:MAG: beta-ketoacyl-[acyl-carrier-protein] synthase II [Candidatus Omnitrophica bacterium CG1_02_49_10]|nr:MAG: beta-ketoacyl-[acyl-carrier-protein] synthase II [Candidatus Omnitrophica bacterium CG1_02_49_10]